MGLIPDQQHLTVTDPSFEAIRKRTYPGMAHFAGSGPTGQTCRACNHWTGCGDNPGYYAKKGIYAGSIKPRACSKYQELMRGETGNAVPHDASACKYFYENKEPPPIVEMRG